MVHLALREPRCKSRDRRQNKDESTMDTPHDADANGARLPPLLLTKTHAPLPRPNAIRRPRLTARLNAGLSGKLTLLSAPPGFGKTTLLAEWRAALPEGWVLAWVALGPEDNDSTRFWSYVIAALQTVQPNFGAEILARLHSPQPPHTENALAQLLNALAALPQRVILVLDDYHVIQASAIHRGLDQFLEYLPPTLHLVLAARQQPPLALANLRARGQLTELRAEDLRCTAPETAELLNIALDLHLDTASVEELAARTEGWFAGLHLAALSLRDRSNPATFIRAFTGSHRYLLDYLGEEVLERQSPEIRDFLLHTAILNQLCAPLCDALLTVSTQETPTEDARSQDELEHQISAPHQPSALILHTLERANLFITPLDDEHRWYRYHPLFAEFLQERLRRLFPERVAQLHRRACTWYRAQAMTREAVEHALAAEDFENAAALVTEEAEFLLRRGDAGTVLGWLDALPLALVRKAPILGLLRVWMSLLTVEVENAAQQLAAVARDLEALNAEPALWGRWHTAAAYLVRVQQADFDASAAHVDQALELLPVEDQLWRNMALMNLALIPLLKGDASTSAQRFEAIVANTTPTDDLYSKMMSLTFLGRCQIALGLLQQAESTHHRALTLAERHGAAHWPNLGYIYLGLGMLERERQNFTAALEWTERAAALGAEVNNREIQLNTAMLLVNLRLDVKDFTGAEEGLALLAQHISDLGPAFRALYDALQTASALAQEDLPTIRRWVETCGLALPPTPDAPLPPGLTFSSYEMLYFTLARALLRLHRPIEAHCIAETLRQAAASSARTSSMVKTLALDIAALQAQNQTAAALALLEPLLDLAEPEGHFRSITEVELPGMPLLADVLRGYSTQHPARDYVRQLLTSFPEDAATPSPAASPSPTPLLAPLTERELEILRLLRTELSAPEIAERLYVAPSTVRSHIKRLYAKLDAHNRGEAIARAQSLGLL